MMRTGGFTGFDVEIRDPGIAWIRFNTPERLNGFRQDIKRDLIETVLQAQMDHRVRVLVVTGEGRAFCAGDDISGQDKAIGGEPLTAPIPHGHDNAIGTYEGLRHLSQTVNLAFRNCDKVAIAAINGLAIQTGMTLALACDFRIAAESARLGNASLAKWPKAWRLDSASANAVSKGAGSPPPPRARQLSKNWPTKPPSSAAAALPSVLSARSSRA